MIVRLRYGVISTAHCRGPSQTTRRIPIKTTEEIKKGTAPSSACILANARRDHSIPLIITTKFLVILTTKFSVAQTNYQIPCHTSHRFSHATELTTMLFILSNLLPLVLYYAK